MRLVLSLPFFLTLSLTGCGRVWFDAQGAQGNLCAYPEVGACSNRFVLDIGSTIGAAVASGVTNGMPADVGPSCYGTIAPGHALVWTAPADGTYTFDTNGSEFDTILHAMLGSCDGPEIACDGSYIERHLIAGDRLVLVIDGAEAATGRYVLNIDTVTQAACVDDGGGPDCSEPGCRCAAACTSCSAVDIGSSVGMAVAAGSLADACDEVRTHCEDTAAPEIFFRWTPPDGRRYRLDTEGGEVNASVTLLEGGTCSGAELVCNYKDPDQPDVGRVRGTFPPGEPLLVALTSHGNIGDVVLNVVPDEAGACANGLDDDEDGPVDCDDPDCAEALACTEGGLCANGTDDDGDGDTDCADSDCVEDGACTGASIAGCPAVDLGTMTGGVVATGTTEPGTSSVDCGGLDTIGPDVSHLWTAPADGTYLVQVTGEYDVVLHARLGSCTGPVVACDDTDDAAVFEMAAGQQLVIFAESHEGGMGAFEIHIAGLEADCGNGIDDDGDGDADCADLECGSAPSCTEAGRCDNGVDDDSDGATDCGDDECTCDPACVARTCPDADLGSVLGMAVATDDTSMGRTCGTFYASCKATQAPERTYLWRAPFSGTFRFDTAGSEIGTVVYLLAGGCDGLEVGCHKAELLEEGAVVSRAMEKNETVLIVVDGQHDEVGPVQLNIGAAEAGRCGNGIDDDGDGLMDCADEECVGDMFCCAEDGSACVCR